MNVSLFAGNSITLFSLLLNKNFSFSSIFSLNRHTPTLSPFSFFELMEIFNILTLAFPSS